MSRYLPVALAVAAGLAVALPAPYVVRLSGAVLLAFFVPGWTLIDALRLEIGDVLERLLLAVGLSYAVTVLVSLIVLYCEGQVAAAPIIGVLCLGSLALAAGNLGRGAGECGPGIRLSRRDLVYMGLCVAVAAFFAFVNLGYADYWGDEMNGLLRAISVIAGRPQSIFEHTKGPVEILVPAAFGLLVGRFDPFTLRFPFALAHVAGVGAFYLLVRRMFSQNVALLAAALLAINGLHLAFGRMVQYQTVVFLTAALSILAAYRYYRSGDARYLGVSACLTGIGLLAHYDTLLTLPVIAYLVWRRYAHHRAEWKAEWPRLALAGALLLLVTALFYLPFVLAPHLAQTSPYLARRIGGTAWPANNADELYVFAVLYNSIYYVAFIAGLGAVKLLLDLRRLFGSDKSVAPVGVGRGRSLRRWAIRASVAIVIVMGAIALLLGRADVAPLIVCSELFLLLIAFAPVSVETRAMVVWFAVSFVGYMFLVDHPRTHLRVIYAPWLVLAALAVAELARRLGGTAPDRPASAAGLVGGWMAGPRARLRFLPLRRARVRLAFTLCVCLLFLLFAGYEYLLFVDTQAEYILTYPEHKSQLYWEDPRFPFGSRRPYGTPHRLGWQMVNHLFLDRTLQGDWDSNDAGSNLFWYTLGSPHSPCYPRYYFAAQFRQREAGDDVGEPAFSLNRYARIGQIWNRDRLEMDVYEFAPLGGRGETAAWLEPARYDSFVTPGDFRAAPHEAPLPAISTLLPAAAVFRPGPAALRQIADGYADARIVGVRDKVALVGYDLDDRWARPAGVVALTLYWQALEVVNLPYKVFVHLESTGDTPTWAQADDLPACGTRPTPSWPVGQVVADRHLLELPPDIPAGDYLLRVGLYEPRTAQRMDLLDVLGNPQGTGLDLGRLPIRAAE